MVCKKIIAESFRNIEHCDVEFSDGVNILLGDNAQGKTNLIEALYYTALGKSFRPAGESELIRFDMQNATVENIFETEGSTVGEQSVKVKMFSGRGKRVVEHNGMKLSKMSELMGIFRVVLFCPEHLSLIQGGPELRRNYLNVALSQLRPVYLSSLQRYVKILRERNSLIKNAPDDMKSFNATIDFWSSQLAHEAAVITKARADYLKRADVIVSRIFEDMSVSRGGSERSSLEYVSRAARDDKGVLESISDIEETYMKLLSSHHDREIAFGSTLYGVHRDDIKISLDGRAAKIYASQGQQRSLALAMKLSEGDISAEDNHGDKPVYLFDDVLSELDTHRRSYLMEKMNGRQVIMSSCEMSGGVFDGVNVINVQNGTYKRLSAN